MDQVVLRGVTKRFATKTLGDIVAVDDFTFSVREGECFSFLGPSGCGKSTTLRMIAGFEDLSEGEIELCGRPVSVKSKNLYVPPEERGLGMVFQAFAVWPHMNVFENVAFPLRIQKMNRTDVDRKVADALAHTSLTGLEKSYPSDLSGGQQQRIALARAIVTRPKVMLLDEPLSNLDPKLRESMRFEIKELQRKFNFTIIFVTHDQSEAMAISDRMMVCDMGRIMQIDTPENLYTNPVNRFVHSFLGESTFLNVVVKDGQAYAEGDLDHPLGLPVPADAAGRMVVATRPNAIELSGGNDGYQTHVEKRIFLTDRTEYLIPVGNQTLKVQTPHRVSFSQGEKCAVRLAAPVWYPADDEAAEKERLRRQLV
ncbi:ABC transporter ATP-binding protein [Pyramidobacter sp.]|uniref:ABC transporter ATP-binding protein n=1 Tax=Pyramidobacter sp. TaxID=1943581 RepID=UPI0025DD3534|nr:ABC transporter ATP-binding protein [Pyramidobacter sp.]MCI7404581.1 ABC transporter ATP-binding protein [Pyramidobacter sp.]MDY3212736.1 ABC transporter ATP-binding protein [Pyramidobacter sp.]